MGTFFPVSAVAQGLWLSGAVLLCWPRRPPVLRHRGNFDHRLIPPDKDGRGSCSAARGEVEEIGDTTCLPFGRRSWRPSARSYAMLRGIPRESGRGPVRVLRLVVLFIGHLPYQYSPGSRRTNVPQETCRPVAKGGGLEAPRERAIITGGTGRIIAGLFTPQFAGTDSVPLATGILRAGR